MLDLIASIKSVLKHGYVSKVGPDDRSVHGAYCTYLGKENVPFENILPYGLYANPPVGTPLILMSKNGVEANLAGIPYGQKDRFKNLKEGEVKIGNPVSGAYILFSEDTGISQYAPKQIAIVTDDSYTITCAKDFKVISQQDVDFTGTVGKNKFNNLQITTISDSRLLSSNATGDVGTTDLIDWVHTTSLLVTDDGDGGVNIDLPTSYAPSNWNSAYLLTSNATVLATPNTLVLRDANARSAVNLNDSAVTPQLSVDAALRTLNNVLGAKILDWSGADLTILDDSGNTKVTVERSTGRVKIIGLIINNEATLTKYNLEKPSIAFSGIWAASQTVQLTFQIVGNVVTILFPAVLATATTASYISATLPAAYYSGSATQHFFVPRTVNNGTDASAPSLITIDTHGVLKIYNGVGNFTGSGSSGFRPFCLTYSNS
jgi:hypothetical protein